MAALGGETLVLDVEFAELHIEDQDLPAKSGHLDWRASLNFDSLEATVRNLSQQ